MVVEVADELSIDSIAITDKVTFLKGNNIISSGEKGLNAISYVDMIAYMSYATVSAIPVKKGKNPVGLTGLTSFLDACIMGQPIIMSDNTNISVDIEALEMGVTYRAGDRDDFKQKLQWLLSDSERFARMQHNCRKYGLRHDYETYCRTLYDELNIDNKDNIV